MLKFIVLQSVHLYIKGFRNFKNDARNERGIFSIALQTVSNS